MSNNPVQTSGTVEWYCQSSALSGGTGIGTACFASSGLTTLTAGTGLERFPLRAALGVVAALPDSVGLTISGSESTSGWGGTLASWNATSGLTTFVGSALFASSPCKTSGFPFDTELQAIVEALDISALALLFALGASLTGGTIAELTRRTELSDLPGKTTGFCLLATLDQLALTASLVFRALLRAGVESFALSTFTTIGAIFYPRLSIATIVEPVDRLFKATTSSFEVIALLCGSPALSFALEDFAAFSIFAGEYRPCKTSGLHIFDAEFDPLVLTNRCKGTLAFVLTGSRHRTTGLNYKQD
jgi:hypothetical protein